ncbi:MAG: vWA domain-containing protein [Rhodothermus sp.]|nr:vWA domain-containing protein [Rhodothermus sp.]
MLQLAWPQALYILLLGVTLAFAIWSYRRTSHLKQYQRLLLTLLRGGTLGLLVTLLADPLLVHTKRQQVPAELALLIDDSASLPLAARDTSQHLAQRLQQTIPWEVFRSVRLHLYRFGAILQPLPAAPDLADSLHFQQIRTNLSRAIQEVRQRHPQLRAIVLISDGQFNDGPSPLYEAERLGVPVFTVAVGDTTRPRDLWIDRVETNTIAYVRSRLPVTAYLQARGFAQTEVIVALEVNGQEIERQRHTLIASEVQTTVSFTYEPQRPGLYRVGVRVYPVAGEFLISNNGESVTVRVLERRRRLLLIGAAPDPDLAMLQRLLARNTDLEVITRVQRDARRFYGGPLPDTLETFDLIILAGYPGRDANPIELQRIAEAARRVPLLFLLNAYHTDLQRLRVLTEVLPARPAQILPGQMTVAFRLSPAMHTHTLFDLPGGLPEALDQLPPLRTKQTTWTIAPDARLLATGRPEDGGTPVPLLLVQERGGHRRAALLGSGLWRWSNLPAAFDELRAFWEALLENLVQWLTAPVNNQRVRIWPERETFGEDEPVRLLGEVYDERLAPVDNATVTVEVWSADSTHYPFRMEPTGNGRYHLRIDQLPQGLYRYQGQARREKELLGRDSGYFAVGMSTLELKTPWADYALLRQLARRTRGHFFTLENAAHLSDVLQRRGLLTPEETWVQTEWRLRMTWPPLFLIILLLTLEWVLRKRFGIV